MAREFHTNSSTPEGGEAEVITESAADTSKKKKGIAVPIVITAVVLFLIIGIAFAAIVMSGGGVSKNYTEGNNGAMVISVDDSMTDEEVYDMLAKNASSMRVHVWQAPAINGDVLSLGFENSAGNTYDQAFRVIQNEEVIYESFPIAPGESVKDVECKDARVGRATVEIFNVVDGTVYGNGVRCEVVIIGTDNEGNRADRVEDVTGVLTEEPAEEVPVENSSEEPGEDVSTEESTEETSTQE